MQEHAETVVKGATVAHNTHIKMELVIEEKVVASFNVKSIYKSIKWPNQVLEKFLVKSSTCYIFFYELGTLQAANIRCKQKQSGKYYTLQIS